MKTEKNPTDRRVKKTKSALKENFLLLLEKTPVNRISVSELCKLSDINRSTFYAYYSSPMDLLEEMERDIFAVDGEDEPLSEEPSEERMMKICARIYENKAFCKALFGPHGDTSYLDRKVRAAHDRKIAELKKKYASAEISLLEYSFTFIQKGATGVMEQWIQNDYPEPPEQIAKMINRLGESVVSCLGNAGGRS